MNIIIKYMIVCDEMMYDIRLPCFNSMRTNYTTKTQLQKGLGYKWVNPWLLQQYRIYIEGSEYIARGPKQYRIQPWGLSILPLGLQPPGNMLRPLGIYPVLLQEPWVNLYITHTSIHFSKSQFVPPPQILFLEKTLMTLTIQYDHL